VEHLYAIADGEVTPGPGEPGVIFCVGEFGPLNLQSRPGRQWTAVMARPGSRYPPATRIAIICDNYSPRLTTARDSRVGARASASNVELALRRIVSRANVA
jgi:hypothetical protein